MRRCHKSTQASRMRTSPFSHSFPLVSLSLSLVLMRAKHSHMYYISGAYITPPPSFFPAQCQYLQHEAAHAGLAAKVALALLFAVGPATARAVVQPNPNHRPATAETRLADEQHLPLWSACSGQRRRRVGVQNDIRTIWKFIRVCGLFLGARSNTPVNS